MSRAGRVRTRRDATHETPILSVLETRVREIQARHRDPIDVPTVQRLTALFGEGDHPALRRAAYRKIEATCFTYGNAACKIVWQALHRSRGKTTPDRWFLTVVLDEFDRAGLTVPA